MPSELVGVKEGAPRAPAGFVGLCRRALATAACLLASLAVHAQGGSGERVLRVGAYNFAPMIAITAEGKPRGLYIDMLEHVAAREGWKLEYVNGSWAESLERIQKGEIDLQPSIGRTPARDEKLDFNNEALFLDWGVIYRQKGRALESVVDLDGLRIAALKGSIYTEGLKQLLTQFGVGFTLVEKSEYTEVLAALNRREVDAGVITKVYGLTLEDRFPNVEPSMVYFSPVKLLFAVPQGRHTDVIETLDRHFSVLKADKGSVFHELHEKWVHGTHRKAVLPSWFPYAALGTLFLVAFLFASRRVLQRQVAERTQHLQKALDTVRQSEDALRASEHRFRDLVNTTDGIVWEIDARTFAFTFVSQKAEFLLGYLLDDWLKPGFWSEHLHPEDRAWASVFRSHHSGRLEPYNIEYRFLTRNGETVWLHDLVTVAEEEGAPRWLRGIMIDVTERKRIELELQALNRELEQRVRTRTDDLEVANHQLAEANKEMEAFAYSISHDLRVPLRAIDGFSHMLLKKQESVLNEEGRRLLRVVRENSARMSQLIDDILALSRAGRHELHPVKCDMAALVGTVWKDLKPLCKGRKVDLTVTSLPVAWGDPALLRQVWQNLLANAIKFSARVGEASILVAARHEQPGSVTYLVQDNGAGFDQAYVGKLFGVFQRLHGIDEFEGTGVGLAIVKSIISKHGGSVRAEGAVGKGATLYFTLPAKEA